jgi:hypothetical protein
MAALVISMGVLAYGYDSAFIGTTITHQSFKQDFGLLPTQKTKAQINEVTSNITSICMSTKMSARNAYSNEPSRATF